jgi:thioredoxin 1
MVVVDAENFDAEVKESRLPVVVDLWGPKCVPCLALMPDVTAMADEYEGKVKFCKINVGENRRLAIALKVMGVPTFLFFKGGEQQDRITGEDVTLEAIRSRAEKLLS